MPIVHPAALDDLVVLLFPHFPTLVIRIVDHELAHMLFAVQPFREDHRIHPFANYLVRKPTGRV